LVGRVLEVVVCVVSVVAVARCGWSVVEVVGSVVVVGVEVGGIVGPVVESAGPVENAIVVESRMVDGPVVVGVHGGETRTPLVPQQFKSK
jgi:hypothetical protein